MTFVRPLFVAGFSRFVHGSMGDSRASLGLRPSFVLASPGSSADTLADQRQCGLDPRQGFDNLSHGINKVKIDAMSRAGQTQQGAVLAVMQGTIRPARLRVVAGHGSIANLPGGGGFVGFGHSFPPVLGGDGGEKVGIYLTIFPTVKPSENFNSFSYLYRMCIF